MLLDSSECFFICGVVDGRTRTLCFLLQGMEIGLVEQLTWTSVLLLLLCSIRETRVLVLFVSYLGHEDEARHLKFLFKLEGRNIIFFIFFQANMNSLSLFPARE